MVIEKRESNEKLKKLIEDELERYEAQKGVPFNFAPFSFFARENHRGKSIGTQLINSVEEYYKDQGFNNINLCTNEFQAPKFYEKLGFELEFVRKNKDNPKLNKYFYVKFFNGNK